MSKGQGNRNLGHNLAQKPIALMEEQIVGCESGTETCVRQGGREAKPPLRHQKKISKTFKKGIDKYHKVCYNNNTKGANKKI